MMPLTVLIFTTRKLSSFMEYHEILSLIKNFYLKFGGACEIYWELNFRLAALVILKPMAKRIPLIKLTHLVERFSEQKPQRKGFKALKC